MVKIEWDFLVSTVAVSLLLYWLKVANNASILQIGDTLFVAYEGKVGE